MTVWQGWQGRQRGEAKPERYRGLKGWDASVAVATWLERWEGELDRAGGLGEAAAPTEAPGRGATTFQGSAGHRMESNISDNIAVNVDPCKRNWSQKRRILWHWILDQESCFPPPPEDHPVRMWSSLSV